MKRKGIVLAGGTGSRLFPVTKSVSKQLLPIHDKPMIYYPISVLMIAGVKDILLICNQRDLEHFKNTLKFLELLGVSISYAVQDKPNGIAEALIIGEKFLDGSPSILILGDNIFFGNDLFSYLESADKVKKGATLFSFRVDNPKEYGVAEFDGDGNVVGLQEKPSVPPSNYALTGMYFYDENAPQYASKLKPSARGELEITDLNLSYLDKGLLNIEKLGRGFTWFDTGTSENLIEANQFVYNIEKRQGLKICSPEEISLRNGWIDNDELSEILKNYPKNNYSQYLANIMNEF